MYKTSLIVSLGIITLLMGGCSGSKESEETESTPQPTESTPAPSPTNSPTQSFEQPGESETGKEVYGLIPSTNPDQRRTTIIQGRQDPFALIPVQPSVNVKPAPPKPPAVSTTPPKSASSGSSKSTISTTSTTSKNSPNLVNSPGLQMPPAIPKAPQPELAKAVEVTGVIDIGGVPQIIVKAPDEQFSRYVQPGQYLSNGQVLVKRIEMNQGSTPVVVLEELGMEVYKEVGRSSAQTPT